MLTGRHMFAGNGNSLVAKRLRKPTYVNNENNNVTGMHVWWLRNGGMSQNNKTGGFNCLSIAVQYNQN